MVRRKLITAIGEGIFNIGLIVCVVWLVVSYTGSDMFQDDMVQWAKRPFTLREKFNLVMLMCTFGSCLYIMKCFAQFYYGILEVAFAIATSIVTVNTIHDVYASNSNRDNIWFGFGSAIYLLVRGLSNVLDGWQKGDFLIKRILAGKLD